MCGAKGRASSLRSIDYHNRPCLRQNKFDGRINPAQSFCGPIQARSPEPSTPVSFYLDARKGLFDARSPQSSGRRPARQLLLPQRLVAVRWPQFPARPTPSRFVTRPVGAPFRSALSQNAGRLLRVNKLSTFGLRKPFGNVRGNSFASCEHGRDYTELSSRRCSPRSARSNSSFCWVNTASSA